MTTELIPLITTPDEAAGLEVSAVSVGRAEYFMDLLTENKE